jgi:methylthioribose-1-phosphate isomerase
LLEPGGRAIAPAGTRAFNPAFDVTPARLVTGIVSEHGVYAANRESLAGLREIVACADAAATAPVDRRGR